MPAARMPDSDAEVRTVPLEEQIRRRAHEIYLGRGAEAGSALSDWLQAEEEILREREATVDEASQESFPASDVSWSEAPEQRGLAAPPLAFRRCVTPEIGNRKADLRIDSIGDDVKVRGGSGGSARNFA